MKLSELTEEKAELQIAPLIDVVFLLLIYFMVTAALIKKEADMSVSLPGQVEQTEPVDMPDEQIIDILHDGRVLLNNRFYGEDGERELPELEETLIRYREASESLGSKALITLQPEDDTRHERVIDVLNACAGAGIKNLTFGMGE
jgi:biopolymer transport protein ExbD